MPTYSYSCPSCGHEFDKFQKITDETPASCPECGTPGQRRITGGAGLLFKGSGFYITDYKRAGEKGESKSADRSDKPKSADKKSKDKPTKGADS